MSTLSIFIDESGDYGNNSDFYLLTLVFHDQQHGIDQQIARLEQSLDSMGYSRRKVLHTGPLIRREEEFAHMSFETRRKLLARLLGFAMNCTISYKTFVVNKHEYPDEIAIANRLAREISLFFQEHMAYFTSFDKVIAYYDNGQLIVTRLVNTVFGAVFFDVEFRRVLPSDYRLFQCADLFCTLELMRAKESNSLPMTKSEQLIFESRRKLKRDYLRSIDKLCFDAKEGQ